MINNDIALQKLNGVVLEQGTSVFPELAMSLTANIMSLGFVFSKDLFNTVTTLDKENIAEFGEELVSYLRTAVGADVQYQPMYPNFPEQVAKMDDYQLLFNALCHYWSFGEWKPDYATLPREYGFEPTNLKRIDLLTMDEFNSILTKILSSSDSISEADRKIVEWFNDNRVDFDLHVPDVIPYKENICLVAAMRVRQGDDILSLVKTGTDVMRVFAYLSGGDISLSENVKFKSQPKKVRRQLTFALDKVLNDEDLKRRPNQWVKMAHSLHVGDFSRDVWELINKVRENSRRKELKTFNGRVEQAIKDNDLHLTIDLLQSRPGDFTRRISELVDKFPGQEDHIAREFSFVIKKVPTRLLTQLWGYLNTRRDNSEEMFVMPKGSSQKAIVIHKPQIGWSSNITEPFITAIMTTLTKRFSKREALGKVYIDEQLKYCPLPTQMRSASKSLKTLARGSRIPFGDNNTLRLFIYWKGRDIDLSATFHDEDFNMVEQISYTNLRLTNFDCYHSGDITSAPYGASEFIDVNIEQTLASGIRYVAMNVYVFSGPNFSEHEICYAGWMTRSKPNSNEIYDPTTVEQKSDLTSKSRNAMPALFDLKTREVIWMDMTTSRGSWGGSQSWGDTGIKVTWRVGNNVQANKATTEQMVKFFMTRKNKINLYDLFALHATARGELVENREEADYVFALDGDTTPFDVMDINSEFVVD